MGKREKAHPAEDAAGWANGAGNNENPPMVSIPQTAPNVKDLLCFPNYLEQTGAKQAEVAELIRERFPRASELLLESCVKPDEYGVVIHPDGLSILCERYGIQLKRKRRENRKLGRKCTIRVTESDYAQILTRVKRDGFLSVQAWIYHLIHTALEADHE